LQPLIDNLHNKLSGWRAGLLSKGDRLVLVKSVLAATPIHIMLATDIPKLIKDAIIKCQRNFFWANGRDDGGGSCAVAWKNVCRPTDLGGLGVLDIKRMSWALRARWPWLGRTDNTRPWANFPIKVNKNITSLLHAATVVKLGNGSKALFWTDRWIHGESISDLAPQAFSACQCPHFQNPESGYSSPYKTSRLIYLWMALFFLSSTWSRSSIHNRQTLKLKTRSFGTYRPLANTPPNLPTEPSSQGL
jgi:hypothetical protein